jgi:hypothetical protein
MEFLDSMYGLTSDAYLKPLTMVPDDQFVQPWPYLARDVHRIALGEELPLPGDIVVCAITMVNNRGIYVDGLLQCDDEHVLGFGRMTIEIMGRPFRSFESRDVHPTFTQILTQT